MSQPVKLSDGLVLDARLAGESVARSIAGQVEYWARLGRSIDLLLNGRQALALCRNGATQPLSELTNTVDSAAGRARVAVVLERQPFPHFRAHADKAGLLEKIDADGTVTIGRFVNREFRAIRGGARAARKK